MNKDDILNMYRHSRGLSQAAERLARAEGVVKCPVCSQVHDMGTPHPSVKTNDGVVVEHRTLKVPNSKT